MFPGGINPRQMNAMMKQMGIKSKQIDATEVIIKTANQEIVITNPQVTEIDMKGTKTYQIAGESSVRDAKAYTEEDVQLVVEQASVSEEQARKALEEHDGDIAESILALQS